MGSIKRGVISAFVVVIRISVFLPMAKRAVPKVAAYYFYLLFVGFSKKKCF